ncbi:mitogen-activated protein kinase kinase kinase [Fistulifera solaris]|uniref:Mitogen-activated protein kinase kinase kinase n=1 Tax=Fistulifera solaris TaxID=1519565 RepID=A0A1Z5JDP3_FISSO|nr:mitogen-activated protein kinase kinase kinase [Fistulifera solaris]|eukprot:GAX12117.1 mitogen-activated protein kinase kinase kinase [Fistulifera solaris]
MDTFNAGSSPKASRQQHHFFSQKNQAHNKKELIEHKETLRFSNILCRMPGRTASQRKVPVQNGGILAALGSNSVSLRTPPKTLIVSKRCDSASSEDEDDVSILQSPQHEDSSLGDSSSEQESSCEETDDELSVEDEEEDDDSSCKSAIKEDSSISFSSVEDDDLEIDQSAFHDEGNASENSTDEIQSDHDEESDIDPDDTLSDDEELDADEESIESESVRNKESKKSAAGVAHRKSSATIVSAVKLCENECSMSDDETVSVVAEIVEDSDTEQSCIHSNRNEDSYGTCAVLKSYISLTAETMDQTSTQIIEQRDAEQNEERKIFGDDHGSQRCDDVLIFGTDDDCERVAEDPTIHFSVKSSSNSRCPQSPKATSAEQHQVREVAFLSDRASKQYRSDANGLLSPSLSISPIKSCFTPERPYPEIKADKRSSTNEKSRRADEKFDQKEFSGVNALNQKSSKPNFFSPIVARSDVHTNKDETESDCIAVSTHTPSKKATKDNEDPSIVRSINRAIRSLLRPDKAASKTNIQRGEWVLGSKLGSGAFGVVHVGMNTATGSLMAVKSIRMENVPMEDVRREIELLKSLDHPNIVVYHGAEMDAKYLHIFQEWVPGGSLCSMLDKFGPFRLPVLKSYLSQILKGLAYLHQQRVMHRDLKGSNVLVNDAGVVKLADFGSSKRFEGSEGNMLLSLTMRGTPYFMAPEVFEEKYTFKADIWSVGCVAFQMATASPPWKDMGFTNPVSLFNHVKASECLPAGNIESDDLKRSNDRASLTSLLCKCFQRDHTRRPDAVELLCDPFFDYDGFSDDEEIKRKPLFSESLSNEGSAHSRISSSMSLPGATPARRNSLSSLKSPFFSPPISSKANFKSPIPRSPQANPKNWPAWARINPSEGSAGKGFDKTCTADSLAYSSSKTTDHSITGSPLMGLKLLSIS